MVFFRNMEFGEKIIIFCSEKKREFKLRHLVDERTLTQKITKTRQKLDFIKFS